MAKTSEALATTACLAFGFLVFSAVLAFTLVPTIHGTITRSPAGMAAISSGLGWLAITLVALTGAVYAQLREARAAARTDNRSWRWPMPAFALTALVVISALMSAVAFGTTQLVVPNVESSHQGVSAPHATHLPPGVAATHLARGLGAEMNSASVVIEIWLYSLAAAVVVFIVLIVVHRAQLRSDHLER